ncbi:hypothetical protein [Nocardioides sp. OK12]|uniref:hypothetical protein n=1 Tax=Nocardioides sp. OK12 TaxID=2758661 RepID=UPI0021C46AD0|nr:hypothetical protein [Nocardioides sp. OK12]
MSAFLHNLAVTVFYGVTWIGGIGLFVGFSLNAIEGVYKVRPVVSALLSALGALLLLVGMSAAVSGFEWEVVR